MAKEVCYCVECALFNDSSVSFMIFLEASGNVKPMCNFSANSSCADMLHSKLFLNDRTHSC